MSAKILDMLRARRGELEAINVTYANWPSVIAWHDRTRPLIGRHFDSQLSRFDELREPKWYFGPRVYVAGGRNDHSELDRKERAQNDTKADQTKKQLLAQLDSIIDVAELDISPTKTENQLQTGPRMSTTNNVFIVHGHDDEMKQHAARTLTKLGLTPIILHEQANGGRTIIEKFEKNADVGFAVILLSPDDMAYPIKSGDPSKATPRARQNVVLELGYFTALLGRDHVFALKRGTVEIPSDISGVVYTDYDPAGHWRFDLVKELRAVGYTVDANALI